MISSSTSRRRLGFTLVELLVVIAIIGMLVALLLPAVQSARGTARTTQCNSQMGEIALAIVAYESARGSYPGYSQYIKRGQREWATLDYSAADQTVFVDTAEGDNLQDAEPAPFSWAAMLLRDVERQDIWDQIVAVGMRPPIRPIEVFICPSDTDATSLSDRPALSYIANTGAWDLDESGEFLYPPNSGDVAENGVMFNTAAYEFDGKKVPKNRLSGIRDGANMTILLSENIHRAYEPTSAGGEPAFTWAYGNEQQVGMVWVVNLTPQPGIAAITDQEGFNRFVDPGGAPIVFNSTSPQFARPASSHSGGVNAAFCEGHVKFINENIDYLVYQRLLTTNGSKCEDPMGWRPKLSMASPEIRAFRTAAPLSESDFE